MSNVYDIIVVGLGAMGSASAYQLSKTSKRVLGIDQFTPPHSYGSSHGDTRITRLAIGEGSQYTPLSLKSSEVWRELEDLTGKELYNRCGCLVFGPEAVKSSQHGTANFLSETIAAAKQYNIEHEVLEHNELVSRYQQFIYDGTEIGYYEKGAGFLKPELCIETQNTLAGQNGVDIKMGVKVLDILPKANNDGVDVVTEAGTFEAESVVITAGAWVSSFVPKSLANNLDIYRQVLLWLETEPSIDLFSTSQFSTYIRIGDKSEDTFYGFPAVDGPKGGIKLAEEQYEYTCTPETLNKVVSPDEVAQAYGRVSRYIKVKPNCIRSVVCMYTVTPDSDFVIDRLTDHPQVIVASPCSGHGFKHSAGIGCVLSELALGSSPSIDISSFSMARFSS